MKSGKPKCMIHDSGGGAVNWKTDCRAGVEPAP